MTAPDRGPSSDLTMHRLAPGADFLHRCAARVVATCAARLPDLSGVVIVVPNLMLAPGLRGALASAAGRPLLLPRIVTLSGWADPLLDSASFDRPAYRQMRLFAAVRDWRMLDGNSRWQIADFLVALLTLASAPMPGEGPLEAAMMSVHARLDALFFAHQQALLDRDAARAGVYPDPVSGVAGAAVKFMAIFAVTQVPLSVVEALLTVAALNVLAGRGIAVVHRA